MLSGRLITRSFRKSSEASSEQTNSGEKDKLVSSRGDCGAYKQVLVDSSLLNQKPGYHLGPPVAAKGLTLALLPLMQA